MKKIEILAPAGSFESLIAAVNANADAVYIGGSKFGARAYANNLIEEDMRKAIDYAHLHGKNIYLTINTLLKDSEVENELYEYLVKYYKHGIDAVIVQDVGVLKFIHEHFKDLPIHVSTQMTLTMAGGLKILEEMGVTRLVTSRELNLAEIKTFRENTNLEIESFVHGALCYCYSGQCLMSSMLGGRSGNRGRCAQPCRMPYELKEDGRAISNLNHKYLLSPKDICTLSMVPDLIEAGIDSFKIEGRMKRPEYTAVVVSKYRKYVDLYTDLGKDQYNRYIEKNKKEYEDDIVELMDIYNRGSFTNGYYDTHNSKNMISLDRPNHNGILIGSVIGVKGNTAQIKLSHNLNPQDLLEIREKNEGIYEFTVKNGGERGAVIQANFLPKSPVKKGQSVYRTKNQRLLDEIKGLYIDNGIKEKIQGRFIGKTGEPMVFEVSLSGISVKEYGNVVEPALNQPMSKDKIRTQLEKTNATEFVFEALEIIIDDNIFIPVAFLNEIRRAALIKLEVKIVEQYRREVINSNISISDDGKINKNNHREDDPIESSQEKTSEDRERDSIGLSVNLIDTRLLDTVLSIEEVDNVYIDMAELPFETINETALKVVNNKKNFYLVLPSVFRRETCEVFLKKKEFILEALDNIKGFLIKNFEEYDYLVNDLKVTPSKIILDYNVYTMNKESKKFYENRGITHYTASVELNYGELRELGCRDSDIIVYGHLPLMVSAQCLMKTTKGCTKNSVFANLTDRYNKNFYVKNYCNYCYNVIYNSQPISLLDNFHEVSELKPRNIRLNFTIEEKKDTANIIRGFVDVYKNHKKASLTLKEFTRGHFKRGIE